MKLTCVNAIHAGTPDNPACRSCNCVGKSIEPVKTPCRNCGFDKVLRTHGLCSNCYSTVPDPETRSTPRRQQVGLPAVRPATRLAYVSPGQAAGVGATEEERRYGD